MYMKQRKCHNNHLSLLSPIPKKSKQNIVIQKNEVRETQKEFNCRQSIAEIITLARKKIASETPPVIMAVKTQKQLPPIPSKRHAFLLAEQRRASGRLNCPTSLETTNIPTATRTSLRLQIIANQREMQRLAAVENQSYSIEESSETNNSNDMDTNNSSNTGSNYSSNQIIEYNGSSLTTATDDLSTTQLSNFSLH